MTHSSASPSNLKGSFADTPYSSKISLTLTVLSTSIPLFFKIVLTIVRTSVDGYDQLLFEHLIIDAIDASGCGFPAY
ncbi:hypothetical protein [Methanobrevibacter sp.]|uniref:hypothetical protein n=1 Tax=Methanobrevibacter sp. TaxID=66852 RepID=UPI003865F33E